MSIVITTYRQKHYSGPAQVNPARVASAQIAPAQIFSAWVAAAGEYCSSCLGSSFCDD